MERDQRRHQQPVDHGRPTGTLLVLACLIVAIVAAVWGLGTVHRRGSGGVASAADGGASTTTQTFLQSLDAQAGTVSEPSGDSAIAARLAWSEGRPMTEAAADMLRAYREIPTAHLALSGYIDIKGNLWGAVVRDDRGWVDMVTVAADEGDASCRLRAVRLVPQKTILKEGS